MLRVTAPPSATPAGLLTATYRPRLSGAVAGDDERITSMIEDITRLAERMSPGRWIYATYQERIVLNRSSQRWLYLQARPVAAVTSVAFGTEDALAEGTDDDEFAIWPKGLYRQDSWDTGEPGWLVTYTGGYWLPSMSGSAPAGVADIDVDGPHLRQALWLSLSATWARERRPDPMMQSEKAAQGAWSRAPGMAGIVIPPAAAAVFQSEGGIRQ